MLTADPVSQAIFQQSAQSGKVRHTWPCWHLLCPKETSIDTSQVPIVSIVDAAGGNILQGIAAWLTAAGVEHRHTEGSTLIQLSLLENAGTPVSLIGSKLHWG